MIEDRAGITIDFIEWYNHGYDDRRKNGHDLDGLQWLNHNIKFDGFMFAPIGVWYGKCVEAKTQQYTSLTEFVEYCKNTDNKIFLYNLTHYPNTLIYRDKDRNLLPAPELTADFGFWKVRYGEIVTQGVTE